MTIEFRCSQCNQLLRVPETSAGKNARCPKCANLMQVPSAGGFAEAPPPPPPTGAGGMPSFGAPAPAAASSGDPFSFLKAGGGAQGGGPPNPPPATSPFGAAGAAAPIGGASSTVNPYASPVGLPVQFKPSPIAGLPINPQRVAMDPIFNYAWQVWKVNLGLLVGVTVIIMAISMAISMVISGVQFALDQGDQHEAALAVYFLGQIISYVVQTFLGLGNVQIALKLARGQPAEFTDLFGGGPLFLPVVGISLLTGIMYSVGFALLIVPGVILMLMFWPTYYLVADQKTGVLESFSVAQRITEGNWGTAFVLALLIVFVFFAGCAALCIGLLFAAPLITMIGAVAYLMMSGQIPVHYGYPQR